MADNNAVSSSSAGTIVPLSTDTASSSSSTSSSKDGKTEHSPIANAPGSVVPTQTTSSPPAATVGLPSAFKTLKKGTFSKTSRAFPAPQTSTTKVGAASKLGTAASSSSPNQQKTAQQTTTATHTKPVTASSSDAKPTEDKKGNNEDNPTSEVRPPTPQLGKTSFPLLTRELNTKQFTSSSSNAASASGSGNNIHTPLPKRQSPPTPPPSAATPAAVVVSPVTSMPRITPSTVALPTKPSSQSSPKNEEDIETIDTSNLCRLPPSDGFADYIGTKFDDYLSAAATARQRTSGGGGVTITVMTDDAFVSVEDCSDDENDRRRFSKRHFQEEDEDDDYEEDDEDDIEEEADDFEYTGSDDEEEGTAYFMDAASSNGYNNAEEVAEETFEDDGKMFQYLAQQLMGSAFPAVPVTDTDGSIAPKTFSPKSSNVKAAAPNKPFARPAATGFHQPAQQQQHYQPQPTHSSQQQKEHQQHYHQASSDPLDAMEREANQMYRHVFLPLRSMYKEMKADERAYSKAEITRVRECGRALEAKLSSQVAHVKARRQEIEQVVLRRNTVEFIRQKRMAIKSRYPSVFRHFPKICEEFSTLDDKIAAELDAPKLQQKFRQ